MKIIYIHVIDRSLVNKFWYIFNLFLGRIIVQANSPSSGDSSQLKRERFIFKPVHVRLLEKYFAQDPYPNISKREEISQHLNHSYLAHKGSKKKFIVFF